MWRATLGDPGNVGNVADCPRASGNLTRLWGQVTAERAHQEPAEGHSRMFTSVPRGANRAHPCLEVTLYLAWR